MDLLFTEWSALLIGSGTLIGAIWLWSDIGNWCLEYWTFLRKAALIDGPPVLPIFGNALHFIGDTNELLNKFVKITNVYTTPLRVWMGPRFCIVITNPCDIETFIKSPHATQKSSDYRFIEKGTGPGLLTESGPTHKIHRNVIMPMVNGKVLNKFIDTFETQSRRFVECLESHVNGDEFDMKPFLDNWSGDIILDTIYGVPSTVQHGGNIELMESLLELNSLCFERILKIWLWPDWIYSRTRAGKKFNNGLSIARKFLADTIAEKKKIYYDSKNSCYPSNLENSALLDQLIAYNEEHKLMDDVELSGEIATMFMTALEPPAHISLFALLMLAMHSEIQDKVRAEVQQVIGDENVTAKKVAELKYLEMVIKETIRLFPIAVLMARETTEDIKFSSFTAPKGCTVLLFMFKTHRDPRFWREPNKFDPDRFLPENSVGRHPYAFLPFSSGIRGCVGQQYATIMMKTMVSRIVQTYRLHSSGSLENLRLSSNLFVQSLDGYKVSITRL